MKSKKPTSEKSKAIPKKYDKLLRVLLIILIFVLISLLSTLLLEVFGVVYFDEGIHINRELFDSFKNAWYGYIIIVVAQVVITSLLSFVPGASMAFIVLVQSMYSEPWIAFALSFSGVMLSSLAMYLIGRFGGYNLGKKIIGEEDCEKASDLMNHKGLIYFPMMMMFPVFPDDALVMVAGTLKMSLKWFIPSIVIGRGIGVATIVFGLSIVPFEHFTTPWQWIGFVLLCASILALVFFLATKFNNYMEKKRHQK